MRLGRTCPALFATGIIIFSSLVSTISYGEILTKGSNLEESRWHQFRGNLNNTGYSTSSVPRTNSIFLNFSTMWPIFSSAVYSKGIIYFGSQSNYVYAVRAVTGEVVWSNETGAKVDSTPFIHDDMLYVGSSDSKIYAFNSSTGEFLWSYQTGGEIVSSPKYYNGSIFFGSKDWNFYAINVTDQSLTWGATFPTGGEIWGTPAIADGRVFFGSNDGNFYSLWADNGTVDWTFTLPPVSNGSVKFTSAAVYNGRVVFGSNDFNVYCLDEFTGEEIWRFTTGDYVYSSPAVHNNTVYVSSNDFNLYALPLYEDGNGIIESHEVIWSARTDDFQGGSSPAVADGKILIGSTTYGLMVFNEDGTNYWNFTIPGGSVSSPTVVDGKVFIGGQNGVMYGIGESGLPSLDLELAPDSDIIKSNRVMGITFFVSHDGEPVEGAFVSLTVTLGELSQQGASTFSDGTNRVKYTAPPVLENTTITITAIANKFGYQEASASYQILVQPTKPYGNLTTTSGFPWMKYLGYIIALAFLIVLNLVLVIILLKRKKREEEVI